MTKRTCSWKDIAIVLWLGSSSSTSERDETSRTTCLHPMWTFIRCSRRRMVRSFRLFVTLKQQYPIVQCTMEGRQQKGSLDKLVSPERWLEQWLVLELAPLCLSRQLQCFEAKKLIRLLSICWITFGSEEVSMVSLIHAGNLLCILGEEYLWSTSSIAA